LRRELSTGDLPALILAVLSTGPRHGYSIAREVERLSDQALKMREGSLYPALRVLEQDGLISGEWQEEGKGAKRKVYRLTQTGAAETQVRTKELQDYSALLQTILGRISDAQPA
jgi:PadR family transcriptional regulator, regulatory protein PadR